MPNNCSFGGGECEHPILKLRSCGPTIYDDIASFAQCRLTNHCNNIGVSPTEGFDMFFITTITKVSGACLDFIMDCINRTLSVYPGFSSNVMRSIMDCESSSAEDNVKPGSILVAFYNVPKPPAPSFFRHIAICGADGRIYQHNGPNGKQICELREFQDYYSAPESLIYVINDYIKTI